MTRRRLDAGQSTVEFALILPFFVLLVVALLDVAILARDQLLADALARDAARVASTASSREELSSLVAETVGRHGSRVASFDSVVRDGIVTVRVAVLPRASMTSSAVRWLDKAKFVVGEASFSTEFAIEDG